MNSIVTVVVTYNRLDHLKNVINLIRSQLNQKTDIIIINNGSNDGTAEWLSKPENKDLIVFKQENLGGAGGFNRGLKEAYRLGYEYFWLMDDDVYPENTALFELLKIATMLKNKFGFLASFVKSKNNMAINLPNLDLSINQDTNYPSWADSFEQIGIKISSATFVSVLFHRNVIQIIGLPIKEFFIWGDDIEYTFRASKVYPSYFIKESVVIHKRNLEKAPLLKNEVEKNRIEMHYYSIRNNFFNLRSMNSGIPKIKKTVSYLFHNLLIICRLKNNSFQKVFIISKALLAGFFFNPKIEKL